jgi:hypothetical protein
MYVGPGEPRVPRAIQPGHRALQGRSAVPPHRDPVHRQVPGLRADFQKLPHHPPNGRRCVSPLLSRPLHPLLGSSRPLSPTIHESKPPCLSPLLQPPFTFDPSLSGPSLPAGLSLSCSSICSCLLFSPGLWPFSCVSPHCMPLFCILPILSVRSAFHGSKSSTESRDSTMVQRITYRTIHNMYGSNSRQGCRGWVFSSCTLSHRMPSMLI